jgi:hypothetical protein
MSALCIMEKYLKEESQLHSVICPCHSYCNADNPHDHNNTNQLRLISSVDRTRDSERTLYIDCWNIGEECGGCSAVLSYMSLVELINTQLCRAQHPRCLRCDLFMHDHCASEMVNSDAEKEDDVVVRKSSNVNATSTQQQLVHINENSRVDSRRICKKCAKEWVDHDFDECLR